MIALKRYRVGDQQDVHIWEMVFCTVWFKIRDYLEKSYLMQRLWFESQLYLIDHEIHRQATCLSQIHFPHLKVGIRVLPNSHL